MKTFLKNLFSKKKKFSSMNYWESRYSGGSNSGDGSYGRLADFKAQFLNQFIIENKIETAIEFGCGDGNQLSLINYSKYLGLDVSASTIKMCIEKFKDDSSKSFMLYETNCFINNNFIQAELTLSLDVLYHIVEENLFIKYLKDLFATSSQHVIIYSTNFNKNESTHVLHREFLNLVKKEFPHFGFVKEVANPFPGNGHQESEANFFLFKRI